MEKIKNETNWPHAPPHHFGSAGTYMITGATYQKLMLFADVEEKDFLQNLLFDLAKKHGFQLEAWAIFSNHYHMIGRMAVNAHRLQKMIAEFHMLSASWLNKRHKCEGRQVWFQFRDSHITYAKSH